MRAYADSSFILRLITGESGSEAAIAEYRRLGKPALFFLSIHDLEVQNAILQRAFHQRRSDGPDERQQIRRRRDAALARLAHLLDRGTLSDGLVDMDAVFSGAKSLSITHTERIGARAIDLLHVSAAIHLKSDLFLTTDARQAELAKAEGLKVVSVLAPS